MFRLDGKVAIVTNPTVAQLYLDTLHTALSAAAFEVVPVLIPDGEEHKNLETVSALWKAFLENGLDRKSTVIALGGGVIGDMIGFAAATYMRGIQWIGIPTTLLSMVDASLRATILAGLQTLNRDLGISIMYITHDLTTAYQVCDNIMVMYGGSVVEAGAADKVIREPQHPYTQLLIASIPSMDRNRRWVEDEVEETTRIVRKSLGCKFGKASSRLPRSPLGSITMAGMPSSAASSRREMHRPVLPLPVMPTQTAWVVRSLLS